MRSENRGLSRVQLPPLGRWSSSESLVLCRAAAWQPVSWAESNWAGRRLVFLWAADVLKLPDSKPSEITFAYLLVAFFYLPCSPCPASLSPLVLHLCDDKQLQAGLPCTGTALTAPRLTNLSLLASTHYEVLGNNNHAFCSVVWLLFGKYPLAICSLAEGGRRAANS